MEDKLDQLGKDILNDLYKISSSETIEEITNLEISIKSQLRSFVDKYPHKMMEVNTIFLVEYSAFHCLLCYQRDKILKKEERYDKSNLFYDFSLMTLALQLDH